MKKTTRLLAGIVTAAFLVCGVGGCKKEGGASGKKTELLIGAAGGDSLTPRAIMDNFVAEYSDKYDIKWDESGWSDMDKKFKLQLSSKSNVMPVVLTDSMTAASHFANGALLDLSDRIEKDIDASLYTKALTATGDGEHVWGVPQALNPVAVLYNKDIFDERGVPYPTEDWTYADMIEMADKLTFDRDGDGEMDVYGIYYSTNSTDGYISFLAAHGTSVLKDDYRNSNLDDPKVKEAFQQYMIPRDRDNVPPKTVYDGYGNIAGGFANGVVAMLVTQASNLATINSLAPDLNYDAQIMPKSEKTGLRACVFIPNIWAIYSGADEAVKDAAWDWIKFYISEESQKIAAADTRGGYPIMKSALELVSTNGVKPEGKDAFYRGIDEYGITLSENPFSVSENKILSEAVVLDLLSEDFDGDYDRFISDVHQKMQEELDLFYSTR